MPPPRPEQRHRVEGDDDVYRVVVARGEDEQRLVGGRVGVNVRIRMIRIRVGLGLGLGLVRRG